MEVNATTYAATYNTSPAQQTPNSSAAAGTNAAAEENKTSGANEAAVYEKSDVLQTKYKPDTEKVQKMIKEANDKSSLLRTLVEKLLNKQGLTAKDALGMLSRGENVMVPIDDATRKQAQEDISEDGYYGVKQTSQRILDFAMALTGGDPSKIGVMRDAVEKGFKAAEKAWGGELPDISKKTYDAVMKGFDEWEKSSNVQKA